MENELKIVDDEGKSVSYAGIPVYMNGKNWIVPPLSVLQLRSYEQMIKQLAGLSMQETMPHIPDIMEIFCAAIKRNYPDVTLGQVEEMVDVHTLRQVMSAITSASRFRPAAPAGEAAPMPGESTGPSSSARS